MEEESDQTVQHLVQDSLSCRNIAKFPSVNPTQKHSNQTVFCHVVNPVQYAISKGLPQKKGVRPDAAKTEIKYVKGVSFVNHCLSAKSVPNVPNVVRAGCRGQTSKILAEVGNTGSESKDGLHLANTFKMETPETIRVSLHKGEWVTSLDFSDAYFHIPIHPRSRKYLRFFLNSKAYEFTALPFGLATARLEFTKVVQEVKLMAQARGIRIHQYLDDWLLRAPDPETCQQNTQTLLDLCRELGWVVNMKKSELVPQQIFNFVGYRFDLLTRQVLPTVERWEALRAKLLFIKNKDLWTVRQLMSLIGLLTATEKQVWLGRLHMRPIQWHLKKHWHVLEVLDKEIPVPPALHPHLDWWLDEKNVLRGQPLHPLHHALQVFRRIKRRLGRSLRGLHSKRRLVRTRKSPPYKLFGTKSSVSGSQEFPASL